MEVYCIAGYKESVLFKSVSSFIEEKAKIVDVMPLNIKDSSKNFAYNIWPALLKDGQPIVYGFVPILVHLIGGSKVLPLDQVHVLESLYSLFNAALNTLAPFAAASQSIVVKEEMLAQSEKAILKVAEAISAFASIDCPLFKAIFNAVLSVIETVRPGLFSVQFEKVATQPDAIIEEAVKNALNNLGIPERYNMSPAPAKPMLFTTPIYYVNGVPHIGHVFTTTLVESLSNWYKLRGINCVYSTGTDEHGMKVQTTAAANNFTPQEWCDKTSNAFREAFKQFDIHPDDFIRTTEERHVKTATHFWNILLEKGYIYKGTYEGWYSKREECFVPENQVKEEIINGETKHINTEDGAELFWSSESNWMFRLSAMQQPLLDWLDANPTVITPRVYFNQVRQMVSSGLNDISVSRQNVTWGVPVPNDPSQTMYVWIDALSNYLTVAGWGPESDGIWPADLHTVGKDILKFHAIYWPAFLIAAGVAPYKRLLVHGWWTVAQEKMSKSLGNTLDPVELSKQWGLEPVKYYLLREATLVSDSDYSDVTMLHRYNNDLADVLANLVLRFISPKMIDNMLVPEAGELTEADKALIETVEYLPGTVDHFVSFGMTRAALDAIWGVIRDMNKYITVQKPWVIKKTDIVRFNTIIYTLIESLRIAMVCLTPFMPRTAKTILTGLGAEDLNDPEAIFKFGLLKAGTELKPVPVLFPKKTLE